MTEPTVCKAREERAEESLAAYLLVRIVGLAAGVAASDFVARAFLLLGQLGDTSIPEGSIVYSIQRLLTDGALYRDYTKPPYATTAYGPLLYLVTAATARLLGLTRDAEALYRVGRLVVFLACVGCMGLLYRLARSGPGRSGGLLAALALAWCAFLLPWAATTRPDLLAVFFSLAALTVLGTGTQTPGLARLVAAAGLVAVACAAKQTAVAAPAAGALWLLWRQGLRSALVFTLLVVAAGVAEIALFQCLWPYFWQNVAGANVAPLSLQRALVLTGWFAVRAWPLVVWGILGWVVSFGAREPAVRLFQFHAAVSLALAVAASAKAGAALNYFLEPCSALAFFVPYGVRWFRKRRRLLPQATGAVLAVAVLFAVVYRGLAHWWFPPQRLPTGVVLRKAAAFGRPVLFQDAGLAVRYGEPILLLDTFNASYLCDAGVVDLRPLARQLHRQEIRAVVLRQMSPWARVWEVTWLPRPVAREIAAHYELVDYIEPDAWFYAPKSGPSPVTCEFSSKATPGGGAQRRGSGGD